MDGNEKTRGENLEKELFYVAKNAYEVMEESELGTCREFCEGYKNFLDKARTERMAVNVLESDAQANGFVPFNPYRLPLEPGDRFYAVHRNKAIALGVIGRKDLLSGINVLAAHIDCPRVDLKPNPLYEEEGLAYFKTHYYGGIKKYQWTALPLSLYGIVMKKDGSQAEVSVGDRDTDPVFCITDLLPHLAAEQMEKKMKEAIRGEGLNILIGSRPFSDDRIKEKTKLQILSLLSDKYGICEEDFQSAELEAVPAFPARDVGFDRSMVGAYGHDDRVCAYTAAQAVFSQTVPERTCLCLLVDKEEVGSMGNTGMQSRFFENMVADLCDMYSVPVRKVLSCSHCLSADVNVAFDPNYAEVSEKRNAARLNGGVVLAKYTGSRGKAGSSDAPAELIGSLRQLFSKHKVLWQTGELGRVDQGGGGTVAQFIANLDVETIDAGVSVLSMHSPFEVVGKADVYMTYKAFDAFLADF